MEKSRCWMEGNQLWNVGYWNIFFFLEKQSIWYGQNRNCVKSIQMTLVANIEKWPRQTHIVIVLVLQWLIWINLLSIASTNKGIFYMFFSFSLSINLAISHSLGLARSTFEIQMKCVLWMFGFGIEHRLKPNQNKNDSRIICMSILYANLQAFCLSQWCVFNAFLQWISITFSKIFCCVWQTKVKQANRNIHYLNWMHSQQKPTPNLLVFDDVGRFSSGRFRSIFTSIVYANFSVNFSQFLSISVSSRQF